MKKIILFTVLFFFVDSIFSQEKKEAKWTLKFAPGYYLDVSRAFDNYVDPLTGMIPEKTVGGKAIWIEGGYKLPNKIIVGGYIMYASLKNKYMDPVFQGQKYLVAHQNYAVNFGYRFNLGGQHKFVPSVGVLLNIRSTTNVDYGIKYIDNQPFLYDLRIIDEDFADMGFNLSVDYYYQFKNKFFIGARANAIYLFTVSTLEGLVFSPVFGFKF